MPTDVLAMAKRAIDYAILTSRSGRRAAFVDGNAIVHALITEIQTNQDWGAKSQRPILLLPGMRCVEYKSMTASGEDDWTIITIEMV